MRSIPLAATLVVVIALLAALAACGVPVDPHAPVTGPLGAAPLPPEDEFLEEIDRTRGHRDVFLPLRDPEMVPADRAPRMLPDEIVLGLDLGDAQVAYPIQLLNGHEIVEHTVAGLHLLACW